MDNKSEIIYNLTFCAVLVYESFTTLYVQYVGLKAVVCSFCFVGIFGRLDELNQ